MKTGICNRYPWVPLTSLGLVSLLVFAAVSYPTRVAAADISLEFRDVTSDYQKAFTDAYSRQRSFGAFKSFVFQKCNLERIVVSYDGARGHITVFVHLLPGFSTGYEFRILDYVMPGPVYPLALQGLGRLILPISVLRSDASMLIGQPTPGTPPNIASSNKVEDFLVTLVLTNPRGAVAEFTEERSASIVSGAVVLKTGKATRYLRVRTQYPIFYIDETPKPDGSIPDDRLLREFFTEEPNSGE